MKNVITIATVNFHAVWGEKETNLNTIAEYADQAGKQGADLVVFPETALSGYDDDERTSDRNQKMHVLAAETIPGPATARLAEISKKYHLYIVVGMPERDPEDANTVYNSAAIIYLDGTTDSYRKLHLPFTEGNWCVRGSYPVLINSEWGPIGVSICYDTYCFPELIRYARAKGARLHLNVTACPDADCTMSAAMLSLPAYAMTNYIFIASSNLCGQDRQSYFPGGSSVVGPARTTRGAGKPVVYGGKFFGTEGSEVPGMTCTTVDLSMADANTDIPLFAVNPGIGEPDYRPAMYRKMMDELLDSGKWN